MKKSNTMLIVGDIHLQRKDLLRSRIILDNILGIAKHFSPSLGTVLLGDVFHDHATVHLECLKLYSNFVRDMPGDLIHVLGNHERTNSVEEEAAHALEPFLYHQKARSPDYYGESPSYVPVVSPTIKRYDDFCLGFIPFLPPNTSFNKVMELFNADKARVVFCHQEFNGAKFNGGKESEVGDLEPPGNIPIISGHIHTNQSLYGGRVWYPGTPVQQDFGDGTDKAVFLIEITDTGYKILEKISLYGVSEFKTVVLTAEEAANYVPDLSDNKYRFAIQGSKNELLALRQTDQFSFLSKVGKIKLVITKEDENDADNARIKNQGFHQILKSYAEKENIVDVYQDIFE